MARAARTLVTAAVLAAGGLALGCGAKAPPRPPTEATTVQVPSPKPREKRPIVFEGEGGAGGHGGAGGTEGPATGGTGGASETGP